ncbi:hypothetical protein [Sphingomonas sp.]|uniref:hypothetical protein n=1 Tax=Sphingomonas sp. TaxID=28214 RepID=UPI0017CBFB58|nr:hypothetical protein [Sphingomonas sp.]MBA3512715.1 hypothetical protein [Sphingomonas sp.]
MKFVQTGLLAVAFAMAGCGGNDPVAKEAENTAGLPSVDNVAGGRDGAPSADGAPPPNGAAAPAATTVNQAPAASIPAALQGRWGMAPADCTTKRGDAKGLLIVGANGLRFYESRAVPVSNVEVSDDSIGADFAFAGEGQTWTKFQTLTLEKDKLVRTESSPMASFTYVRCD